eukprot:2186434-Rhodomonas_salina.1
MTGRTKRARPRGAGRAKPSGEGAERARFLQATPRPAGCTEACGPGIAGPGASGAGSLGRAWCPQQTWKARA